MRLLIFGAGSTGCYIAGQCLLAGVDTTLVCRPRIEKQLRSSAGIALTNYEGKALKAPIPKMIESYDGTPYDLCLVTLKCHHLDAASDDLARLSGQGCEIHFLQNGLFAYEDIPSLGSLPKTFSGIVPFNVVNQGEAGFHQGTEGELQLQRTQHTEFLEKQFSKTGIELELFADIRPIVFGKLLLNLNNALNAVLDLPLKQQLENRPYRKVLAASMREYLAYCQTTGESLHLSIPIPPRFLPRLLELPNILFTRLAKRMLAIDPVARSSMWEDLQAGRKTEIEFLNGKVVKLCQSRDLACPINAQIVAMIQKRENGGDIDVSQLLEQ